MLFLYTCGQLFGFSGFVKRFYLHFLSSFPFKTPFILGTMVAGAIPFYTLPANLRGDYYGPEVFPMRLFSVVIAGLFIGFGTSSANGCTTGHGLIHARILVSE